MATTRQFILHDNVSQGVETTAPGHLLQPGQWRTQHNMRITPRLEQVPRKVVYATVGSDDVRWIGVLPGDVPGYGKVVLMTESAVTTLSGSPNFAKTSDSSFRRWATTFYNGELYYTNELNAVCRTDGSTETSVLSTLKARYLSVWYDHLVVAYPTYKGATYPNRLMISDLYKFSTFEPAATNEADHYDFVEWQQTDYPYVGITGIGKLRGRLIVYTPTAIIPLSYVGLPKVLQVDESSLLTRIGNSYPWSLVTLDTIHFFYDGIERTFFAYDGQQVVPVGEPIRRWFDENLSTDITLASKLYGYVDVDNREIWWPFVSTASNGAFDKAVVFNYRYKKWFTASVEDVQCFCAGTMSYKTIRELTGNIEDLTGTILELGGGGATTGRLFGAADGDLLREETTTDANSDLLPSDDPVLESADFHYGDIDSVKEVDRLVINAKWDETQNPDMTIEASVRGQDWLDEDVVWVDNDKVGTWDPSDGAAEMTFIEKHGKALRYKFVAKNSRGLRFAAFADGVYAKKAER